MGQPVHFRVLVERIDRHNPDVATFQLIADRRLPLFAPGQFIHLAIEDYEPSSFWPESRVFSVANAVADRRTIQLTICRQGSFTSRLLDDVPSGSVLCAKGPYGDFTIDERHGVSRVVLIAGGTGITPFCAFMDAAIRRGELAVEEAVLHYGAKTPALLVYRALADECASVVERFRTRYYAEQLDSASGAGVQRGVLNVATIVADTPRYHEAAFYLSGPKAMIDAFQAQLIRTHGVSPQKVLIDAWE